MFKLSLTPCYIHNQGKAARLRRAWLLPESENRRLHGFRLQNQKFTLSPGFQFLLQSRYPPLSLLIQIFPSYSGYIPSSTLSARSPSNGRLNFFPLNAWYIRKSQRRMEIPLNIKTPPKKLRKMSDGAEIRR